MAWMVSPTGAHEPMLERPLHSSGPNWNAQPELPQTGTGKTQQPHFKIKLPRRLHGLTPPAPTWPAAEAPKAMKARSSKTSSR
jgi:hypothetical protein